MRQYSHFKLLHVSPVYIHVYIYIDSIHVYTRLSYVHYQVIDSENQMDNPCTGWLTDGAWDNITELDKLTNFHGIITSFEQYPRDWNVWYTRYALYIYSACTLYILFMYFLCQTSDTKLLLRFYLVCM